MNKTKNITNELVTEYINGFYRAPIEELMKLRETAEAADIPIILRETEDFLGVLLAMIKPQRILEIGAAVGYSAAYFAAVTGAEVVTIEKDPQMLETAQANIKKLGFERKIRALGGDGTSVMNQLAEQQELPFDFIFIDAAKSHYKDFLDAALPLSKEGSLIVSDNVLFRGRVASDIYDPDKKHKTNIRKLREYAEYIYSHPRLKTSIVACGDGLAISLVEGEENCHNGKK